MQKGIEKTVIRYLEQMGAKRDRELLSSITCLYLSVQNGSVLEGAKVTPHAQKGQKTEDPMGHPCRRRPLHYVFKGVYAACNGEILFYAERIETNYVTLR